MEPDPSTAAVGWAKLSWDLTELILSYLPLRSLAQAEAVCRLWRAVLSQPSFPARTAATRPRRAPWLFFHGLNHVRPGRNQYFAFDPDASSWYSLPPAPEPLLSVSGGFSFCSGSSARLLYSLLPGSGPWRTCPPLSSPRSNPLIAVLGDPSSPRFLVLGGARYVGGLVDIEGEGLDAELYDSASSSSEWEACPPLPPDFRPGLSSQWLSSALLHGRLLFVSGIYSGLVSCLDLGHGAHRSWAAVRTVRPPGVLFSFLLACGDRLLLAGLRSAPGVPPDFVVWALDPGTMGFKEITAMPRALLSCLLDSDDDDSCFASLTCVGLDGLIFVVNEEQHKDYPACVCEIDDDGNGCSWKQLPPLPGPVNRFHKVVAFCSNVPVSSVLGAGAGGQG